MSHEKQMHKSISAAQQKLKMHCPIRPMKQGLVLVNILSNLGLESAFNRKVINNALAALVKITALQKHLFNEGAGVHSKEYSEILIEVKKAAQKLQQEMDGDT